MTQEATQVETVSTEVAPIILPESPMAQAEPAPEAIPAEAAPTPELNDVQIYQDIIARSEANPGKVDMTYDEAEAFSRVNEKVATGKMEDPGLAEKPAETPEPNETPETPEVKPEAETPVETVETETAQMSMKEADLLQAAMTEVGAKDIRELTPKIKGLIKNMKESGGKLGTSNQNLQQQVDQNINFIEALRAKDPGAIAHYQKLMGYHPNDILKSQEGSPQTAEVADMGDTEEFLDNKLAPIVKNLAKEIKALKQQNQTLQNKDTQRDQTSAETRATTAYVDDVVRLVEANPGDFGINPAEARPLAEFYWSEKGAKSAIHPKFQKMHDLISFAYTNGSPNLQDAHVVLQHKNGAYAQKLIQATKDGQKDVQHIESPNSAISGKQGRTKQNVPHPTVTDENVTAMERGDFNSIPDAWMDDQGDLIRANVPERFHKMAFGK